MIENLLIFSTGLAAGFIAAIIGGAGVIMLPALMLVGLTPQMAIATMKFAALGFWATVLFKFGKAGKVEWPIVLPICVIGGIGAYIGTKAVLRVPENVMEIGSAFVILAVLPLVLMKKDLGVTPQVPTPGRRMAGYGAFCLIALYSGFIGVGGGLLASVAYIWFFGLTMTESKATDSLPRLVMAVTSILAFSFADMVNVNYGLWLMAGMAAGGWLGAHTAVKKGDAWMRRIFIAGTIGMVAKLLWDHV